MLVSVTKYGYINMIGKCIICGQSITDAVRRRVPPKTCQREACQKAYTLKKASEGDIKRRAIERQKLEQEGWELIPCAVCGERFEVIQHGHVQKHGLTVQEYKALYPDAPIVNNRMKEKRGKGSVNQSRHLNYNGKEPDQFLFEFLTGTMLGDGSLEKQKNKKNARYVEGGSNKEYIESKYHFLSQYFPCTLNERISSPHVKSGKRYKGYWIRTCVHPILTEWHGYWYRNKIKIVPYDLVEKYLSILALVLWFCDDGCSSQRTTFYTMGFTHEEVHFLRDILWDKFQLSGNILFNKNDQPFISLDAASRKNFRTMCSCISIPGMEYKLQCKYQTKEES